MSVAIITYCLVAVVRNELKLERSTYELLQILSVSLTDKTSMRELFEKQEIEAPDVPVTPFLPGLFDKKKFQAYFIGTLVNQSKKCAQNTGHYRAHLLLYIFCKKL